MTIQEAVDTIMGYMEERRVLRMWYKLGMGSKEQRRAQRAKVHELERDACNACLFLMEVRQHNEVQQ